MKKVLSALCVLALLSCTWNVHLGNGKNGKTVTCKGPVVTKSFDLADFNAIVINGHADLEFAQTNGTFGVNVKANEEVFQHLNYRVENSTLILETVDNVNIRADEFDIYVSAPTLADIQINGAVDASVVALNQQETLHVQVNGAGDLELKNVTTPELAIQINGAADLECKGLNVDTLNIEVNGAGDVELEGKAESCRLHVSGAGDIDARKLECSDIQTSKAGLASIKTN